MGRGRRNFLNTAEVLFKPNSYQGTQNFFEEEILAAKQREEDELDKQACRETVWGDKLWEKEGTDHRTKLKNGGSVGNFTVRTVS